MSEMGDETRDVELESLFTEVAHRTWLYLKRRRTLCNLVGI